MVKNTKFITLIMLIFLVSCGSQSSEKSTQITYKTSYAGSTYKYSSMYYKIVIELMLHKNKHSDALNIFTSNIQYFEDENDFFNMINKARDLRNYDSITTILNRWLEIDQSNIYAHKIAFATNIELGKYDLANKHFDYLYSVYSKKNNKSYIDLEDILSRNLIVNNIVEYFNKNLSRYNDELLLLSYINILQKNNLDSLVIPFIEEIDIEGNRILIRKYSNSLSKLNEDQKAIDILESYINSSSMTDREVSIELITLYLKIGNTELATTLIEKLINIDPSDDDFMFRVALLCFDKSYYSLSEKYFNILLSKTYSSDNINFFLGQIDYLNERYDEALLHYYRIEQGTFVNTKILNIAKALLKKHNLNKALKYIDQEIKIKTKNNLLNSLLLKLSIHEEVYDPTNIIDISNQILKSFPNNERALYSRALAYEKLGNISNMSKDFEVMIKFNPYNSIALNAYGYSLSLHDTQLNYAEELIRKAINIDPGNAAILDSLAWILYLQGSYENAYKYASLAYAKNQDPEIVIHFYEILLKNGFDDKARSVIRESISDNPKNKKLLKIFDRNKNDAAKL